MDFDLVGCLLNEIESSISPRWRSIMHVQLHCFTLEPNPDGGVLEASFSPDAQFVIAGTFKSHPQIVF